MQNLIVMEYAPNGDLLKHLKNIRVCTRYVGLKSSSLSDYTLVLYASTAREIVKIMLSCRSSSSGLLEM